MKKRLLSAILSFCMLLTMAPTVAFAADGDDEAANTISLADATETSGTCGAEGNNVTWKLTQNNEGNENPTYTLTISGSGAMADYYAQYVQRRTSLPVISHRGAEHCFPIRVLSVQRRKLFRLRKLRSVMV